MKRYLIIISYLFIVMTSFAQQFELSRAKRLIQRQEYLEAARVLRPLAESGNAEAQHLAAGLFMEGKGVIKSPKQAEMYYTKAAKADYEPSVLALFDFYEQTNKQVEAAQLLANKYVKQTLPTSLYAKYGLYLYQGKGNLKEDKLNGWKMIFNNNENVDDVLKQDFYESIIQLGKEQPDSTLSLFCKDLWSNENTKLEWTINYLDDVMQLIQVSDSTQQKRIASLLESMLTTHDKRPTGLLLSMMYAEGLGVKKDTDIALKIYTNVVNDELYGALYNNLYKHSGDGSNGHLRRSDFPHFYPDVIVKDYRERAERWDYQKKLKDIKLTGANVFKVKGLSVHYVDGKLSFRFEVFNTSPNPTGRATYADNAFFKYNGKYYDAKVNFHKDYNLGIKGNETTTFTVTSNDYVPASGILDCVNLI